MSESENDDKPNPDCHNCHGEGEIDGYFVNHKTKSLYTDWVWCGYCFPLSNKNWRDEPGFDKCTIDEYLRCEKNGYEEVFVS